MTISTFAYETQQYLQAETGTQFKRAHIYELLPLEALSSPQESVNNHLALPEVCDLFIGIFRTKLGTPLPTKEFFKTDATPYLSGSEYEFHRAWDARRRGASKPSVLIYRWNIPAGFLCPDANQYENLKNFFDQPPFKENGQWLGSLNGYSDPEDFSSKLEGHLRTSQLIQTINMESINESGRL